MAGKKYIFVCMYNGLPVQGYTTLRPACKECGFGYWHVSRKMKGVGSYVRGEWGIFTISLHQVKGRGKKSFQ